MAKDLKIPDGFTITDLFLNHLGAVARSRRDDAGYGGRMDDGGAADLEREIAAYKAGRDNRIPASWVPYISGFMAVMDPEYKEYQRLHRKFAGIKENV